MRVIILGAPGAGKGTQALRLCETFGLSHLSTGDLLRVEVAANSLIGEQAAAFMKQGQLVPNALIIGMIQDRMARLGSGGFLLDGFPRTVEQAESLEAAGIVIDQVISLQVPDAVIIQRLSGRRIHLASGRIYHIDSHPILVDDQSGEPLVQREDDQADVVANRLKIYHQITEPLMDWYQQKPLKLSRISGLGTAEEVYSRIEAVVQE